MDQRMFMAVGLSMLVILGFYLIVPTVTPPPAPPKITETKAGETAAAVTPGGQAAAGQTAAKGSAPVASAPARVITVTTPHYTATLDTRGGRLTSLKLKDYKLDKNSLEISDVVPFLGQWLPKHKIDPAAHVEMVKQVSGGSLPLELAFQGDEALTQAFKNVVYTSEQKDLALTDPKASGTVTLVGTGPNGLTVRKTVTFNADTFIVGYELQVINYGSAPRPLLVVSSFGLGPVTNHAHANRGHFGPMYRVDGKIKKEDADGVKTGLKVNEPQWLGMNDTYFIAAVAPDTKATTGLYSLVPGAMEDKHPVPSMAIELPQVSLESQKMIGSKFKMYLGPKSTDDMLKFGGRLEDSLDLTLDFLASPMLAMLRWFHSFTFNYGAAIILLTIVVRTVLFPLTYKGMVSMKRMAKLQPKIAAMRERLKNDKDKMNREMMEMYRKYKINPLSGCLPILLQIPIFFALYSALMGAIELRHSPFIFWITDLSAMDGLYVLPLLMGGSMFFQQRLTPTSLDPTQAKIMMWMPVIFTFFMLNFPAGLTLYWFTSNLLSILQQLIINRVQVPEFAD